MLQWPARWTAHVDRAVSGSSPGLELLRWGGEEIMLGVSHLRGVYRNASFCMGRHQGILFRLSFKFTTHLVESWQAITGRLGH